MTFMERHIIRHGHPRHMIVAAVSMIWCTYFFWKHELALGLWTILGGVVLARLVTFGMNESELARTTLGKILLLHLHPANLVLQSGGLLVLMYGVWEHLAVLVLTGASFILLGHMWGWHKVNEAL